MKPARGKPVPDLQEELRLAVERATVELRRLKAERDRMSALSADVADTPDGAVAAAKALALQREAMERLREAIRAFEAFASGHR